MIKNDSLPDSKESFTSPRTNIKIWHCCFFETLQYSAHTQFLVKNNRDHNNIYAVKGTFLN